MLKCILYIAIAVSVFSCTARRTLTGEYYKRHETEFLSIQQNFKALHRQNPFSLEIRDREFETATLDIVTDTIRYIYQFRFDEHHLADTLLAYRFNVPAMAALIDDMRKMSCTWITNLDYYEKRKAKYLVFLSLRHRRLGTSRKERYFTVAFFDEAQPYDEKGRLMDREDRKRPRQINDRIFYRINDKVFFTLSRDFR